MASLLELSISLLAVFTICKVAQAGDPDILTDFLLPKDSNQVIDGNYFTCNLTRGIPLAPVPQTFTVIKASMKEFPALEGQSVSMAVLQYPAGGLNPPHTHPRASELLLVVAGSLQVGLTDTSNKLYTQTLQLGDMFIFPKGLVHFQYNPDMTKPAVALSAFESANAGTVSVPLTVFGTGIDDQVLALSFKTDVPTIQKIKAGFAPK